jgi:hypothetical protein
MAPDQREQIALCLLAGLGFGLALAHGDLLFAAFSDAIPMTEAEEDWSRERWR